MIVLVLTPSRPQAWSPLLATLILTSHLTSCVHHHPHSPATITPPPAHDLSTPPNHHQPPQGLADLTDPAEPFSTAEDDKDQQTILTYLTAMRASLHGSRSQAYTSFNQHYASSPNPHTALQLLRHHPDHHNHQKLLVHAKKMALLYPQDAPILIYYATILIAAEHLSEAQEQLNAALKADPNQPSAYAYLIEIALKNHDYSQATQLAQQLSQLTGQHQTGLIFELRAQLKNQDYDRAYALATTILTDDPGHKITLCLLAYTSMLLRRPDEAATILAQLQESTPFSLAHRTELTQTYQLVATHPEIIATYESTLKSQLKPSVSKPLTLELMWLYHHHQDWDKLIKLVHQYANLNPLMPAMKWLLAQATESSDLLGAATIYSSIPPQSSFRSSALERIFTIYQTPYLNPKPGQLAAFMADNRLAMAAQQLTTISSPTLESLSLAGMYYFQRSDYQQALSILKDGYQRFPNSTILLLLAQTYYELNDVPRAETIYRNLLAKNPLNPILLNALGYTLTLQNQHLDHAEHLISLALELAPNQPAYLDSMGWVYYQQDKLNQAKTYLTRASQLAPHDAEIHHHLSQLYLALNDCTQAAHHLDEASKYVNYVSHLTALRKFHHIFNQQCSAAS